MAAASLVVEFFAALADALFSRTKSSEIFGSFRGDGAEQLHLDASDLSAVDFNVKKDTRIVLAGDSFTLTVLDQKLRVFSSTVVQIVALSLM